MCYSCGNQTTIVLTSGIRPAAGVVAATGHDFYLPTVLLVLSDQQDETRGAKGPSGYAAGLGF